MTTQAKHRRSWWPVIAVAVALVCYAVSVGPVHSFVYRHGGVRELSLLNKVYGPLFWFAEVTRTDAIVDRWVDRWTEDEYGNRVFF